RHVAPSNNNATPAGSSVETGPWDPPGQPSQRPTATTASAAAPGAAVRRAKATLGPATHLSGSPRLPAGRAATAGPVIGPPGRIVLAPSARSPPTTFWRPVRRSPNTSAKTARKPNAE